MASLVFFKGGEPLKSRYRRFRIRTVEGIDDFASMEEVLERHYGKLAEKGERPADLVVVDGGIGQLGRARAVLSRHGFGDTDLIGLAKRDEIIVRESGELKLPRKSPALKLLQRVRDEAHRFAITYHRLLRDQRTTTSELDLVPGIGRIKKLSLLHHFGSVEAIRAAGPRTWPRSAASTARTWPTSSPTSRSSEKRGDDALRSTAPGTRPWTASWVTWPPSAGLARATLEAYQRDLIWAPAPLGRGRRPSAIPAGSRPRTCAPSCVERGGRAGARSRARLVSTLRSFGRFLAAEGLADQRSRRPPCRGPADRPHALPDALSVTQVERLLATVGGSEPRPLRDRAILEVLYGCGLRVSELCGMDLVDLDRREATVRVRGKGSKTRVVPVGAAGPARPSAAGSSRGGACC